MHTQKLDTENFKGLFEAWLPELEKEVQLATGKTKVELVQQRAKVAQINKRLATVISGFNGGSEFLIL